jgi:hypothetical protein
MGNAQGKDETAHRNDTSERKRQHIPLRERNKSPGNGLIQLVLNRIIGHSIQTHQIPHDDSIKCWTIDGRIR